MSGRFDYIRYDDKSVDLQNEIRGHMTVIESILEDVLTIESIYDDPQMASYSRELDCAMSQLESLYSRFGRLIRDHQRLTRGDAPDVPERGNP